MLFPPWTLYCFLIFFLHFSDWLPFLVISLPGFKYPDFTHVVLFFLFIDLPRSLFGLCKLCNYFFLIIFNYLCSALPQTVITYFDTVLLLNIPLSWWFIYCEVSCDFIFPLFFVCWKQGWKCIVSANLFPLIFRIFAFMVTWRQIFSKINSTQSLCCISEHLSMAEVLANVMLFYLHSHLSIITVYSVFPPTCFVLPFYVKRI